MSVEVKKKKHPGGRPTKYLPEMCAKVIELMREGRSKTEVAAELGICWDTLNHWQENNPEFSAAIKAGQRLSEAWWEKIARENLIYSPRGTQLNATLWYMNMKNRFGWRDKQEVEHSGNAEKPIELNLNFKSMTDDELNRFLDQTKKG